MATTSTERGHVKPFAQIIREQRRGALHDELSEQIADLVLAVAEHRKVGSLSITLKAKPAGEGAVELFDTVTLKAPEGERPPSIFFYDDEGNLHRNDPRQTEMPLREVEKREAS